MQETTINHLYSLDFHHISPSGLNDSYLQPRFLARKWCMPQDMISIGIPNGWMLLEWKIHLGYPHFGKPLIWYFIDFNPHPHDICQNPSKMASNHRENDQGDCFMSLQSIGIYRFRILALNPPFFWMTCFWSSFSSWKSLVDFSQNSFWRRIKSAEPQNLLLHLTTESGHTGDFGTCHDPGGSGSKKNLGGHWICWDICGEEGLCPHFFIGAVNCTSSLKPNLWHLKKKRFQA